MRVAEAEVVVAEALIERLEVFRVYTVTRYDGEEYMVVVFEDGTEVEVEVRPSR